MQDYAKTNWDIQFKRFYIDDKASGKDFDRSAFNEMLEDIRDGKSNGVIVKDLSRLGRDMIESDTMFRCSSPASACASFPSQIKLIPWPA